MKRAWARLTGDLPLFALLQLPFLLLTAFFSRALAAFQAYPYYDRSLLWGMLLRSLAQDLLALALIASAVLLGRRLRLPDRLRDIVAAGLYGGFWALGALYLVGAGVFVHFGAPPTLDLVRMALPLVGYSAKVVSFDDPLVRLLLASAVLPALFTAALWSTASRLVRDQRRWRAAAWVCVLGLALLTVPLRLLPTNPGRERKLQQVSPVALLLPRPWSAAARPPEPRPEHREVVAGLLGGRRTEGAEAFAGFPRRRRNLLVWVMESAGERFLRAHSPLGGAATPRLSAMEDRASVRFSNVFVECPLSAQSAYALVTAMSPPAHPDYVLRGFPIVLKTPCLPALLKAGGYHTALLNSSYLRIWGERRYLSASGFDLIEDADSLNNRSRYRYQQWSIEGRAIVDRFFEWRDALPRDQPFFAVLWNVEGHYHYLWIDMPPEYAKDDALTRYQRSLEYNDRLLGTVLDGLAARGLDDTLIVAVGDHGQGLGRGGRAYDRFESLLVSEDDIQVPLSFLHPDLPAGSTIVATPATLTDIYPTILDLVGLPVPPGIEGASLAAAYQPRPIVSRAITWWPLSVRAGGFKLVQDSREDPPALYHIPSDPWELHDVSGLHQAVVQALWSELATTTARRMREDPSFALYASKDGGRR